MKVLDWEQIAEIAGRAGKAVAREWRVVEADDLKQECLLWAYENKEILADNPGMIYNMFKRLSTRVACKERDYQDMFYSVYWYTPEEIRTVLKSLTAEEASTMMKKDDLSHCSINDSKLIARVDVTSAFHKLKDDYQVILFKKFVMNEEMSEYERKMSYDAVKRLTTLVNRGIAKKTSELDPAQKDYNYA